MKTSTKTRKEVQEALNFLPLPLYIRWYQSLGRVLGFIMSDQEGPDEFGLHANVTNKEIAKILRGHLARSKIAEENSKKLEEVARLKGIKSASSEEISLEEDEEDINSP